MAFVGLPIMQTFFIVDSSQPGSKDAHKSARACDACYDTVFPLMDPTPAPPLTQETLSRLTLSGLRSMPSLLLDDQLHVSPSVLMAVDFEPPNRPTHSESAPALSAQRVPSDDLGRLQVAAMRMKAPSRPRSYIHILDDFNDSNDVEPAARTSVYPHLAEQMERSSYILDELVESEEDASQAEPGPVSAPPVSAPLPRIPRQEDTVRKRKRFSLPALAIHTTPVTARPNVVGDGKSKRWSLVLGNWRSGGSPQDSPDSPKHGVVSGKLSEMLRRHSQLTS